MEREDLESLSLLLGAVGLGQPATRSETIKEAWRLCGDEFDPTLGYLVCVHDLGIVAPILFEIVAYAGKTVIEAEGVVVAHLA